VPVFATRIIVIMMYQKICITRAGSTFFTSRDKKHT